MDRLSYLKQLAPKAYKSMAVKLIGQQMAAHAAYLRQLEAEYGPFVPPYPWDEWL